MPVNPLKIADHNSAPAAGAEKAAAAPAAKPSRFLCKAEVLDRVGVSNPTIWQWQRDGKFPRSRELGGRAAWLESEIEEWILSRPVRRLKGDR